MTANTVWAAVAAAVLGCSSHVELPEDGAVTGSSQAISAVAPAGKVVKGYRHSPSVSRFRLGGAVRSEAIRAGQRYVGSSGAILVSNTGAFKAVPDATSDVEAVGPFTTDPAVHTDAALSYFRSAGLPADQIRDTRVSTLMVRQGTFDQPLLSKTKLKGYTTVISRQVDGVRVSGSYAWVRFNANGESVAEEVYWPDLPLEVVAATSQLTAHLTDPAKRRAFLAALPAHFRADDSEAEADAEVVVRHSPCFVEEFEAVAAIEVKATGKHGAAWYDTDGREVRLKSDRSTGKGVSRGQ